MTRQTTQQSPQLRVRICKKKGEFFLTNAEDKAIQVYGPADSEEELREAAHEFDFYVAGKPANGTSVASLAPGTQFRSGRNCYTLVSLYAGSALVRQLERKRVQSGGRDFVTALRGEYHISRGTVVDELL